MSIKHLSKYLRKLKDALEAYKLAVKDSLGDNIEILDMKDKYDDAIQKMEERRNKAK